MTEAVAIERDAPGARRRWHTQGNLGPRRSSDLEPTALDPRPEHHVHLLASGHEAHEPFTTPSAYARCVSLPPAIEDDPERAACTPRLGLPEELLGAPHDRVGTANSYGLLAVGNQVCREGLQWRLRVGRIGAAAIEGTHESAQQLAVG